MTYFFTQKKNDEAGNKGFTLLFAVLVSTLVVAIGATIISIALRQTILSGTSRESQYAFYAANTVMECAFYWDVVGGQASSTQAVFPGPGQTALANTDDVTCSGGNIVTGDGFDTNGTEDGFDFADDGWTRNGNATTFRIELRDLTGKFQNVYCAEATVTKQQVGTTVRTTISAKGYNTCDLTNARAVERGLLQSYDS